MSLEAIRKNILAEAEEKAKAINAQASSEAGAISGEAEARAREIVKAAEEESRREVARLWKESEAGLETEKSTMITEARGAVLEKALKTVRSDAERSLAKDNMQGILKSGLRQFSSITGGNEAVIRTSRRNAHLVKGRGNRVEYGDINGFVFSTHDGKISLNATVESIVDRELDTIRKLVADEIFTASDEKKIAQAAAKISIRASGAKRASPARKKRAPAKKVRKQQKAKAKPKRKK